VTPPPIATDQPTAAPSTQEGRVTVPFPRQRVHHRTHHTGKGVLSSLLKLYERPRSSSSSTTTLVDGPTPSTPMSPETSQITDRRRTPSDISTSTAIPRRPGTFRRHSYDNTYDAVRGGLKGIGKWVGVDTSDRPEAARSGAGVFGALQASALGLAGAATPHHSSVAPAPTRPGFRISRYSMPEVQPEFHHYHRHHGSPTAPSSEASTPVPRPETGTPPSKLAHRRQGSHLSLTNLGEYFDPTKYHKQSKVFKAQRTPSQPGTPQNEYDEKVANGGRMKRRKREKRKQDEIFITSELPHIVAIDKNPEAYWPSYYPVHVAAILQRQDFILRLARALMMCVAAFLFIYPWVTTDN
jgi:hypothetical protein